jgi:hypothetical protein
MSHESHTTATHSQEALRGRDMRMDSMRPPVFRPNVVPLQMKRRRGACDLIALSLTLGLGLGIRISHSRCKSTIKHIHENGWN